jgi:hypothetical protein
MFIFYCYKTLLLAKMAQKQGVGDEEVNSIINIKN